MANDDLIYTKSQYAYNGSVQRQTYKRDSPEDYHISICNKHATCNLLVLLLNNNKPARASNKAQTTTVEPIENYNQ